MKKLLKSKLFWVVFLTIGSLTLVFGFRLEQYDQRVNQPQQLAEPLSVTITKADRGTISKWIVGEGTAMLVNKRHLQFETDGEITEIGTSIDGAPLFEGARVQGPVSSGLDGQMLAQIKNREIENNVQQSRLNLEEQKINLEIAENSVSQAKRSLELAKKNFTRSETVFRKKIISQVEFESERLSYLTAENEYKASEIQLKLQQNQLERAEVMLQQSMTDLRKTKLTAPFSGVIARLNIKKGDRYFVSAVDHQNAAAIQATMPVILIDPGLLEVSLKIPVFDGQFVEPGQLVEISAGSLDEKTILDRIDSVKAFVYSVSPVLDFNARAVSVKIRIEQDQYEIPEGLFVTCWIKVQEKQDVLLLPNDSLMFKDDKPYVFSVVDNTAVKKEIQLGLADENEVEVISGINEGEQVIVTGRYLVNEAMPVNIINQ